MFQIGSDTERVTLISVSYLEHLVITEIFSAQGLRCVSSVHILEFVYGWSKVSLLFGNNITCVFLLLLICA